jgi:hypothetical protein
MRYYRMRQAGMKIARFDYNWDAGRTDTEFNIRSYSLTNGGSSTLHGNQAFSTSGGSIAAVVVGTDFANGVNEWQLLAIYTGAGTAAGGLSSDTYWVSVTEGDLYTVAMRYNADGTEKTTGYTTSTVLASEVVADLLGRLLPKYDGANATIETTTFAHEHLAYVDPTAPAQVLADLMLAEPAYYWAAWERNSAGKHRFEWRSWPTTVRYEADAADGYSSTSSADGLYNSVTVRWRGPSGWIHHTVRTSSVPELTAAGITRDGFIDLGDDRFSTAAGAIQAGDQFLAEHATASNAGTLTVARPIYDHDRGTRVMPWEIRPGNLIRVRGIAPNPNSLNATRGDGVTVFSIVGVDYNTSSASATLELDSYSPSIARALAAMSGGTRAATRSSPATFGAFTQRRR